MLPLALTIFLLAALLAAIRTYRAKNHLAKDYPFYSGNFAVDSNPPTEELTVVSYNISYGRNVVQALAEIEEFQSRKTVNILLLQEMDETGVEKMARELQLNFVYYPAAIEPKYHRNFGNAVLSRWPIIQSQKVILPHISLSDRMKRIATRATIRIQGVNVDVYSIHTEPVFILPRYKEAQCIAILDDIGTKAGFVIVGGDFNSFTKAYVNKIEERYRQAGFVRASAECGYTFVRFGMQMFTDQIFAKGFVIKEAGKIAGAIASDHVPVWSTLVLK